MNSPRRLVAVQMDPLEQVDIKGDTTFALMLEAQRRGHELMVYNPSDLALEVGGTPNPGLLSAQVRPVQVQRVAGAHATFGPARAIDLDGADVILMRQDPPFDMAYITATFLLEHVHGASKRSASGQTLVVNNPTAVRNAPEKLLVTQFPQFMPPTLVTADRSAMEIFRKRHGDIIVKPLYGNGGAGVFRVRPDDGNWKALLELFAAHSREPLMLQRYEPAVTKGDKRIILVDGEPIGAINRVPQEGETRSNMHVGGVAEKATLTARDRAICAGIGPYLREHGLILTGIDVIGDWLTEINVTSPTGLQELDRFDGINSAALVWDAIERRLAAGASPKAA
ncbi:glutathione synthase [Formicincola oecophyllae]|uniref:Glutathione synthetase n=1 Tax=Formicincola oecophyllae TaxID=2558361 RepID=A0A4Y6U9M9_9PROT|nr:glutathione synthase [Formicincola oecophyllae]QDH13914.1 glutathione synthase [Formicincola oecophyllae]